MKVLITGCAGFIGYHVALDRLAKGDTVIGCDNLNDYYEVSLKQDRLSQLTSHPAFRFFPVDVASQEDLLPLVATHQPQRVIHLAAQAGVRYSLKNPQTYVQSNLVGFANILEACRLYPVEHLVFASSSSVYGANTAQPYQEDDHTDHPLSLYAATKKSNEMMAHAYAHLFNLPVTGLRFFTVYGPWGRPDMAFFSFTRQILAGKPIQIYHHGEMYRDFTYIDDIVAGISLALDKVALPNPDWQGVSPCPASSQAPYRIYNIGLGQPIKLLDYLEALEQALGVKAIKEWLPMQPGDVPATHADITRLEDELGYVPKVHYQEGIRRFVDWYQSYYPKRGKTA